LEFLKNIYVGFKDIQELIMSKGKDILLVDDEQLFREPVAQMLRNNGYNVKEAANGKEAICMFREGCFDLVITDMLMPGMNGTQLIRAVQKVNPSTEAIVLSAYGTESTKNKLDQIGAFGYLDKPIRKEQLFELVDKGIKSNRLMRLGCQQTEPEIRFNRERILIADDDETVLQFISDILCKEGYSVTPVKNGYEAFEKILVNDYDLIILDINMPKMNGIETVKLIREQDQFVYIFLISGEAETEEIKKALNNGADNFIPKPFSKDFLLEKIKKINFERIKLEKEKLIEKEERKIRRDFTFYQRFIASFTWRKFRRRAVEALILIIGGILIGVFAAFFEFKTQAEKDPMLDRTDKLIDAIKKDWGR
jgi:CheY-like chemotaxis protein